MVVICLSRLFYSCTSFDVNFLGDAILYNLAATFYINFTQYYFLGMLYIFVPSGVTWMLDYFRKEMVYH